MAQPTQPPKKPSFFDTLGGLPSLVGLAGGAGGAAAGAIPLGSSSPGVYTGVPGTGPGTAVAVRPPGALPATIPRAVGPYIGVGEAPAAPVARTGVALRSVLPYMLEGAAALGTAAIAGLAAKDAADNKGVAPGENTAMRMRVARAAGEMALARREGASTGRKAGIALRNAGMGAYEATKAGLGGLIPTEFLSGLFGGNQTAAPLAAPAKELPVEATAKLVRRFDEGPSPAAAPAGQTLTFNQLIPLLQAMPRMSRQPVSWEDQVGGQLSSLFQMQEQAIRETPGLTDEQRSRQLDALRNQLLAAVAKNSLPLMMNDNEE